LALDVNFDNSHTAWSCVDCRGPPACQDAVNALPNHRLGGSRLPTRDIHDVIGVWWRQKHVTSSCRLMTDCPAARSFCIKMLKTVDDRYMPLGRRNAISRLL